MTKIKKSFTFVATVPLLLPIRTAQGSFFLWLFLAFNTPFLPIFILGIPYRDGRFSEILKGNRKITKKIALKILEKFPDVNFEYISTGEGEFLKHRQSDPIHHKIKKLELENAEMKNKIDFVYNISKK